jgi:hypothetical protein
VGGDGLTEPGRGRGGIRIERTGRGGGDLRQVAAGFDRERLRFRDGLPGILGVHALGAGLGRPGRPRLLGRGN